MLAHAPLETSVIPRVLSWATVEHFSTRVVPVREPNIAERANHPEGIRLELTKS
jgi:hypothetical protein